MAAEPKHGDYIRVKNFNGGDEEVMGAFFGVHESGDAYLIDFKLKDSSEYHTVVHVIDIDNCELVTDKEFFLWRLQGRGVGAYE